MKAHGGLVADEVKKTTWSLARLDPMTSHTWRHPGTTVVSTRRPLPTAHTPAILPQLTLRRHPLVTHNTRHARCSLLARRLQSTTLEKL